MKVGMMRFFLFALLLAGGLSGQSSPWPALLFTPIEYSFAPLTDIANARDGSGGVLVVQQTGRVLILRGEKVEPKPFLDISDRMRYDKELGLYSLTFSPGYAQKRQFYVHYTNQQGNSTISRFRVTGADPDVADPASEEVLLVFQQPFHSHNGGQIAF